MSNYEWQVAERKGHVPFDAEAIDRVFDEIVVTPQARSSGWICTLTIECGTVVCACRRRRRR